MSKYGEPNTLWDHGGNFVGEGKGSHRRKNAMTYDEYSKRYDKIFRNNDENNSSDPAHIDSYNNS